MWHSAAVTSITGIRKGIERFNCVGNHPRDLGLLESGKELKAQSADALYRELVNYLESGKELKVDPPRPHVVLRLLCWNPERN